MASHYTKFRVNKPTFYEKLNFMTMAKYNNIKRCENKMTVENIGFSEQYIFKSDLIDGKELRSFEISNTIWFVAKDVAEILGYLNTVEALRDYVDNDDKFTYEQHRESIGPFTLQPRTILINLKGIKSLITYGKKYNEELVSWLNENFDHIFSLNNS